MQSYYDSRSNDSGEFDMPIRLSDLPYIRPAIVLFQAGDLSSLVAVMEVAAVVVANAVSANHLTGIHDAHRPSVSDVHYTISAISSTVGSREMP